MPFRSRKKTADAMLSEGREAYGLEKVSRSGQMRVFR